MIGDQHHPLGPGFDGNSQFLQLAVRIVADMPRNDDRNTPRRLLDDELAQFRALLDRQELHLTRLTDGEQRVRPLGDIPLDQAFQSGVVDFATLQIGRDHDRDDAFNTRRTHASPPFDGGGLKVLFSSSDLVSDHSMVVRTAGQCGCPATIHAERAVPDRNCRRGYLAETIGWPRPLLPRSVRVSPSYQEAVPGCLLRRRAGKFPYSPE